jgi:hypothetical protein
MDMDVATVRAAFEAHTKDSTQFTRRMAINMADFFGVRPMQIILHLEGLRLLKSGSYTWFQHNGGITSEHIAEARADRFAPTNT